MNYYLSQFPEAIYKPHPDHEVKYRKAVERGYEKMAKSNVIICGAGRDIASCFDKTAARLEFLGSLFKSASFFVFENDSKDQTKSKLQAWRKGKPNVHIFSRDYQIPKTSGRSLERAKHMAFTRNKMRDLSRKFSTDSDFVILVDLDLEGGFSYNGIASTFGAAQKWDVVASNGIFYRNKENGLIERLFYDTWAYRPYKKWFLYDKELDDNNLIVINRGEPLIRVNSAFGGLAIYLRDVFYADDALYATLNDEGKPDCDHPVFHKKLADKGFKRIFMNPSQIVLYTDIRML